MATINQLIKINYKFLTSTDVLTVFFHTKSLLFYYFSYHLGTIFHFFFRRQIRVICVKNNEKLVVAALVVDNQFFAVQNMRLGKAIKGNSVFGMTQKFQMLK